MKHKTKGFIAMILALCLMMSLGVGAMAGEGGDTSPDAPGGNPVGNPDPDGGSDPDPDDGIQPSGDNPGGGGDDLSTQEEPVYQTLTVRRDQGITQNTEANLNSGQSIVGKTVKIQFYAASGSPLQANQEIIVTLNGEIIQPNEGTTTYEFIMPEQASTLVARIATYYYVSTSVNTEDGGTIEVSKEKAEQGDNIKVTANDKAGYELTELKWSYGENSADISSGGTFTMPASDVTVTATFKLKETQPDTYNVFRSATSANITLTSGEKAYKAGDDVTFTVAAHQGYRLSSVYVSGASGNVTYSNINGVYSFKMPAEDVTISAVATAITPPADYHRISTYSNDAYGWVSVDETAKAGSTVYFRIAHTYSAYNYDYKVYVTNDRTGATVKYDYDSYHDRYSFTMPDDDVTISVYFDRVGTYSITKDVEGDGSIYVRSSADYRDTVWIEASPNAGQSLTSLRVFYGEPWAYGDKGYYGYWDEADVHYSEYWDAYYFTMPAADVVVYARFTDGATVDVIAGDHGDAKVSSRYAEKGDWVYITAYPDEGYEVDSVTVTDSLGRSVKVTELSYDYFLFTMPGTSVDVKVTFRAKDYDVFYDVSRGDWYYKAVRFVHEKGIMEGTGTHYFSPEADLSRGMLATILYRLEGSPSVSGYSGFSDVADTAYYAKAVAWAKANGIVNGVTATAYEPDTAVTREELAAILCRYAAFKGKDTAISYDYLAGFSDANTSHVYARPALNWAVAYDIINGQGNGVLAPRATATRAEVAQVLMNYLEVFD